MKHCLIVDDSNIIRQVARLIFESLDFRVSEAETAEEAMERVRNDVPDFVFMDWSIPGTNVHELIADIRAATLGQRVFILYVPTENDHSDLKAAFRAGADDYLLKPFNREIVEMKLHQIRVAA
jgi:two-component system, chemotaxis family, chemotaxis protein CheY